jgi:copper transport protein
VLAGLLLFPVALWAHARLLSSDPAEGASLPAGPAAIRLVFSERPELALTTVKLVSGIDTTSLGPLTRDSADANTVVAPVASNLAPGPYTVVWRVAARDGHPLRGTISFTVAAPSDSVMNIVNPQTVTNDVSDASAPVALGGAFGIIVVRWLAFVSLFLMIGAVTFRTFVLAKMGGDADTFVQIASNNAATLGLFAAVGVIISSVVKLARESADMPDVSMATMTLGSTWGMSLLAAISAALGAAIAFKAAHGNSEAKRRNAWKAATVFAVVAGIAPAFGGHAIAGEQAWLAVPADIVHVVTGSAWLGTLAVIVIVGIPAALKTPDSIRPGARVAGMINMFSPIALMCGGAVVATGLGSAVIRLGRIDALWTTAYGVTLSLKLVFVALLFGAGAWNWRRMKPRLTGDDAIAPLRSTASLELVLAGIVLGITAILVALELP